METVSLFVSSVLDDIGYNDEMVIYRRETNQKIQNIFYDAPVRNDFDAVIEENMSEILLIKKYVICLSTSDTHLELGDRQLTFEADRSRSPPGYVLLTLTRNLHGQAYDQDVFSSSFGEPPCLWSLFYFNKMKDDLEQNAYTRTRQVTGAMINANKGAFNFPLNFIDSDTVLKVKSKLKLSQIIQAVSPADGFVFPDTSSRSDISHLEWRISYTRTEQRLFLSLNVTQIKLYVLLNMIGKSTLHEISKEMNSYVMKNIVFWMIHLCESDFFQEKNLVILLITALGVLYNCVRASFIPCFMTEERNLLTKPMETSRKHDLLRMLHTLQQENACMLLRCDKLKSVMLMKFKSPHIVDMYQRQRDRLEQLLLILEYIRACHTAKTTNSFAFQKGIDKDWIKVKKAVYDMVLPEWENLYLEGENVQETVIKRIQEILS